MDTMYVIWDWLFIHQPGWVSNVSNLTSFTILGALLGLYRRYNCDQPGCMRIGLHRVAGTTYRTCIKHTTTAFHSALQEKHIKERPEQHKVLNDG